MKYITAVLCTAVRGEVLDVVETLLTLVLMGSAQLFTAQQRVNAARVFVVVDANEVGEDDVPL